MRYSLLTTALALAASATAAAVPASAQKRDSTTDYIPSYFTDGCTKEKMTIRKEWRHLTTQEQSHFLDALQCLMDKPAQSGLSATTSRFSDLQALHRGMTNTAYADIIHHVGQFLPWHRYYMHIYETLLRDECGYTGSIPYWNEQLDADSGNMFQSTMWGADAFGGNGTGSGSCVTDGRFANMTLHIGPGDEDTDYCLRRAWDNEAAIANANSTALNACNAYTTYSPWWDCISNIPHKGVHTNIGGVMADIKSSPGDPVFFMHHAYIDKVWWAWQKADPVNRMYDISGPTLNHTANVEPAGGWQNATLHYALSSFEIKPNVTIGAVMNTQGGYLCYGYD
ncbi:hypothetical protein ASPACDRAFT_123521 [Aspergillus aculeatus ATCC 16872]|uniref:Tyrosinase copper-binding domain-containing protein n=1 Tax=Aspergillus aculeatus (strain ATCC 16872 / CBS 172.66 / WB 5094) TaxID=690307 RepID=A0A1L9WN79_ASPA1|nr:uncharacterized protein ASPACDRAFT_123521 [Aspergillus aculeatus ATCC 16872]OJJ97632.1 hypothetical protein ASPACDRAFT_123521 [Aspergillus aculeatus ATCC 16872]